MPLSTKARLWVKGRKNWDDGVAEVVNEHQRWVWVHCSSYGEFEDIATVLEKMRASLTTHKFVLTFFSPSGAEKWKDKGVADYVMYLPSDTPKNARKFVAIFSPELVLFSRAELWMFYLREMKTQEIPVVLVGLLLNERSSFLKYPQVLFYKKGFHSFSIIYCQNISTVSLLDIKFNLDTAIVAGNCRLDRIVSNKPTRTTGIEEWAQGSFCIVVGSAEDQEFADVSLLFGQNYLPEVKWILVPHEFDKLKHGKLNKNQGGESILYSEIEFLQQDHQVILVDTVGVLKDLYKHADLAIIGGGFTKKGIHNVIEPAIYDAPVIIGPNDRQYPEAELLQDNGYCSVYSNCNNLLRLIEAQIEAPKLVPGSVRKLIESQLGASERVLFDLQAKYPQLDWKN